MLKLICQAGAKIGNQFKIQKPRYTIGRQAGNDLQLPSPFVSKFHAEIRCDENGEFWIEDLKSTNGTFIDKSEVNQATRLEDGNTIIIGKSDIFKIEITPEPTNVPAYFNINDKLDIQPDVLKSKLKLSAMQQPTTHPITENEESPENVSDSWLKLMDLGDEVSQEFKYSEEAFETHSLDPSKTNWPDVVKMSQKLDSYKKLYRIALDLVTASDKHQVIEKLEKIFDSLLSFGNGVIVLHKRIQDPKSWETQYICETDHQLIETSTEIHQSKEWTSAELFPFKSREKALLYHPLQEGKQKFGFIAISASLTSEGFLDHEKRRFRLVCQLLEKLLAKFRSA